MDSSSGSAGHPSYRATHCESSNPRVAQRLADAPLTLIRRRVCLTLCEFEIVLKEVGSEKIKVIKAVREVTSLGLKEAKEVVDGAPKPIKEAVTKEEAEEIKKKFVEQGATVEIK